MAGIVMKCPHCGNDDNRLIEKIRRMLIGNTEFITYLCGVCSKEWSEEV